MEEDGWNEATNYSRINPAPFHTKEKRIYLLDITESMIGEGDGNGVVVFDSVKNCLKEIVELLATTDPDIEIEIIPFSDQPNLDNAFRGYASDVNQIFSYLESLESKGRSTNIIDAWSAGLSEMDSSKINFMFLLTDGNNNVGSIDNLYNTISNWNVMKCSEYCFSFYVALKDHVNDDEVLRSIADTTQNLWWIHSMNVNVACLRPSNQNAPSLPVSEFSVNIRENHTINAFFAVNNGSFARVADSPKRVRTELEGNPYYRLKSSNNSFRVQNGTTLIPIEFVVDGDMEKIPRDTVIPMTFSVVDTDSSFVYLVFMPEKVNVRFINRTANIMTFDPTRFASRFLADPLRRMDFHPRGRVRKVGSEESVDIRRMTFIPREYSRQMNKK